jgi:hypothetical protein
VWCGFREDGPGHSALLSISRSIALALLHAQPKHQVLAVIAVLGQDLSSVTDP